MNLMEMIVGRQSSKIIKMVPVGCISRSLGQKKV